MDSNSAQNSSEKSQLNMPGGSSSRSLRSRHSSRNPPSHGRKSRNKARTPPNPGRKGRRSSKNNYKSPVPSDKRYQQKPGYRSSNRHHSNKGYNPEEYNHNNSYKPNWRHNNTGRNRNRRNPKWQPPAPRYGNLSWQRNNQDDSFQIPPSFQENRGSSREYFDESQPFQPDPYTNWANSNYFWQQDSGNQQFFDRPQDHIESNSRGFDTENFNSRRNYVEHSNRDSRYRHRDYPDKPQEGSQSAPDCPSPKKVVSEKETQISPQNQVDGESCKAGRSEQSHQEKDFQQPDSQISQQNLDDSKVPEETPCNLNSQQPQTSSTESSQQRHDKLNQTELETLPLEIPFIKEEPPFFGADDIVFNIKRELPEATDSDFDLANCLHDDTDNQFPSISVIPISKLIKSELQDLNRVDIIAPTTPARGRPTLRPNLVQRRKRSNNDDTSGTLTENLIQRVANMDKVGIKNVINNSGTKYDAALKIQARKRLREEIRKQLKSMNFTPPDNSESSVLVPDEIVDSMNIPAVVLDEIRKAFGIVLVEDMNVIAEPEKIDAQSSTASAAQPSEGAPKSPDLMSRLKILEEMKSQTEKVSPNRPVKTTPKKPAKNKIKEDVVVINSSSSSSSSSSSDSDSDSSSTTTDSDTSKTSSYKRRRRKKRILEANVVGNFEKLILPNLTDAQRRRYKEKYSNTTKSSLLYIYGVCVSRAIQTNSTIDPKEKLKLKRNLTSADNAQALEFLMKAILNLFEQHKEKRRKEKIIPSTTTKQIKSGSRSKRSNPVSPAKKLNDSTCNQQNLDDERGGKKSESANSTRSGEHQSTKADDASPSTMQQGGVNRLGEDTIAENANSAQGERGNEELVAQDSDSESDLDNLTANGEPPSRLWKSPGEKKCIEIETSLPMSNLGMIQPPIGIHSLDLESLKSQSSIGDEAVSSIREIDVKLMELHKRKMYIEEMILKLQKDKMEVDLWTMKLQNEKFILLNSALASASSQCAPLVTPKTEKKTAVKRKPFSTPFSEKLRGRKKRCQSDILLEETASESTEISKLLVQPRKTRSRNKLDKTLPTETVKTDATAATVAAAAMKAEEKVVAVEEKKDDPGPSTPSVEVPQVDYTDVENGYLEGWKLPITQIIVVGEAIVAASEDGNIYKFNIRTRQLESKFSKHTEAITQIFTCCRENFVYTTSLDGFLKKTSVENFGLELQSVNLQEPLQSIDIEWSTAFIGSRWGNIFTYDIKTSSLSESLLCSSKSSIIAIKATKEGPRKILIVSSKGNQINFRDAMTGLLLRSLDVPENLHIYSILLDDGCVFCGTQRNEIHQYDFTTGGRLAIFQCGNGAVSMKLYKDKYIFVGCYDGFVYVLDKTTGCQIGRFPGSGKMILALEIAGDKLITSAKDNTMQIIDIPKYIVTKDKS